MFSRSGLQQNITFTEISKYFKLAVHKEKVTQFFVLQYSTVQYSAVHCSTLKGSIIQ